MGQGAARMNSGPTLEKYEDKNDLQQVELTYERHKEIVQNFPEEHQEEIQSCLFEEFNLGLDVGADNALLWFNKDKTKKEKEQILLNWSKEVYERSKTSTIVLQKQLKKVKDILKDKNLTKGSEDLLKKLNKILEGFEENEIDK